MAKLSSWCTRFFWDVMILTLCCPLSSVQGSQQNWGKGVAEICRLRVEAWALKCRTPLANVGQSESEGVQREGAAAEGILLLYWRLHGPLIVCLSFRPGEHVMSPLERVCFFFLSASWQQGALTHLIWPCTAVWCQADCPVKFVCVCTCGCMFMYVCMSANVHVFRLLISERWTLMLIELGGCWFQCDLL